MLKLWRFDQETSEDELFIKIWQKSRQNPFYWDLMLKLDRFLTQTVFAEIYEIKVFISDYTHIPMYLCRVSFLTILDIYKDYSKGIHRWYKKDNASIVWPETEITLVHYSFWRS